MKAVIVSFKKISIFEFDLFNFFHCTHTNTHQNICTNRYVNGAKQNDNNVRNGDEKNVFINEGPHSSGELSGW